MKSIIINKLLQANRVTALGLSNGVLRIKEQEGSSYADLDFSQVIIIKTVLNIVDKNY